jgi:hypothetical protein
MDLIALHLKTSFIVLPSWRDEKAILNVHGLSDFLRFYTRLSPDYSPDAHLPQRLISEWDRMIRRVWDLRPAKATSVCYDLLNASLQSQRGFMLDARKRGRAMRASKKRRDSPDGVVMPLLDQTNPSVIACLVHDVRSKLDFPKSLMDVAGGVREAYPQAGVLVQRFVSNVRDSFPIVALYVPVDWRPAEGIRDLSSA